MKIYHTNIIYINWFKYKKTDNRYKLKSDTPIIKIQKKKMITFFDNKKYNIITKVGIDVISHQPT